MLRILYALCVATLITGTAWAAASGMDSERRKAGRGTVGFVILTVLQR
jgi:hypothetical protein